MCPPGPDIGPLRCPHCRLGVPQVTSANAAHCSHCALPLPFQDGLLVLVTDPATHEQELLQARQLNPLWYSAEQPAADLSPWRHHLRKRRLYVESVLRAQLARCGQTRFPRLLDLGCGDGTNLAWLQPFADQLYGSDYNALRLARARQRVGDAQLFLADVLDYPAFDASFPVVFFNHVLEHIGDDLRALATVRRILAPGGVLILGVPNEGCWWWQLAYKRAPQTLATTDHVHFYTAPDLRRKLEQSGFAVDHVEHLGWGPPDWTWDGRLRGYKLADDLFEWLGRRLLPTQSSSLYLIATTAG